MKDQDPHDEFEYPVRFRCPACGSTRIARIQWGRPHWTPRLRRAYDEGRIVLGSCIMTFDSPNWQCRDCRHQFGDAGMRFAPFLLRGERVPSYVAAHTTSFANRKEVERSDRCGCFHCQRI